MINEHLEDSRAHSTKINDLRIQVVTFILYNFLTTYSSVFYEDLDLDYPFGSYYDSQIGMEFGAPKFTCKFNCLAGALNFAVNVSCTVVIFLKHNYRVYLLPSIIWNTYTASSDVYNFLEFAYDILESPGDPLTACYLFSIGLCSALLHVVLLLGTINYHNILEEPEDSKDFAIWENGEYIKHFNNGCTTETNDVQQECPESGDAL